MQLLTGRVLRRQLQQQMRDPHSVLRSQTAIAHIAAAPTSAYTRTRMVCDPRTSSAVLELGTRGTLNDGRQAAAALEALVAIAHRSVSPLAACQEWDERHPSGPIPCGPPPPPPPPPRRLTAGDRASRSPPSQEAKTPSFPRSVGFRVTGLG